MGDHPSCQAVGATYGLMWFNPALVYGIAMSNAGPESYSLHLVEDGYQSFMERIVQVVTVASGLKYRPHNSKRKKNNDKLVSKGRISK
jgi:hypothetical protein